MSPANPAWRARTEQGPCQQRAAQKSVRATGCRDTIGPDMCQLVPRTGRGLTARAAAFCVSAAVLLGSGSCERERSTPRDAAPADAARSPRDAAEPDAAPFHGADLSLDAARISETLVFEQREFAADDCALVEQCVVAAGVRRLMRFTVAATNIGDADLVLGNPEKLLADADAAADAGGDPLFEYSACHDHYHFNTFATYTLLRQDSDTVEAMGHKQGFCVADWERSDNAPHPGPTIPRYNCHDQGTQVGWTDVYAADVPCQWIDVTDVVPGKYRLQVRLNTAHRLPETRHDNNDAVVTVTVPAANAFVVADTPGR